MRTLVPWHIVRLVLVALVTAALVTFSGFWALVQSIHDPSTAGSVVQRIATPFLPLLGDPNTAEISETAVQVRIVLGGLLWAAILFVVLLLRACKKQRARTPPNTSPERTRDL